MIRKAGMATALTAACLLTFAAQAAATTDTFNYTGAAENWTVPANVTSATFDLNGAQGGGGAYGSVSGGLGGRATATIAVTPGAVIQVRVGGVGGPFSSGAGGFNGGGNGDSGGGGGASDIRIGGSDLAQRVLVAGGAGGGGGCNPAGPEWPHGGAGGGLQGGDAINACGTPGGGGTQSTGGTATSPAIAGTFGVGGNYGGVPSGGGGGGWFGGGGGATNGGGGGGSGYGPPGTTFETGVRSGNGLATITYTVNPPAPAAPAAPVGPTGQRAAALKKCKKYSKGTPRRKKCTKKAQKKPL
jgi:Glycine rich protein